MRNELYHHGIKGQKWGVQNGPPYPLDSETHKEVTSKSVFISGTSKMQDKNESYYRKDLSKDVKKLLNKYMNTKTNVLIGDCVGADTMVQNYFKKNGYRNVTIYVSGEEVRNNADRDGSLGWKVEHIDASMYDPGTKEWHAVKDIAMNDKANSGLAIILDEGAKATRRNIDRFIDQNKDVSIYELSKNGSKDDRFISVDEYKKEKAERG